MTNEAKRNPGQPDGWAILSIRSSSQGWTGHIGPTDLELKISNTCFYASSKLENFSARLFSKEISEH